MPKSLTVTPTFSPYTFDEILKPLELYKKSYDETQEKLDKISDDAGALQYIADSLGEDNPLKASYNTYIQSLQQAAEGMSKGLSMDVVKTASDLRRQYTSVLNPLNQAKETLSAWQKEQREARGKDDSIIFNHDVNDSDILDYITRNPNAAYQSASGDKVRDRVAQAVAGLQNQYRQSIIGGENPEWAETAEGRLLSKDLSTGLTLEDIAAIASNPEQFPELNRILNEAYSSSGINSWGTNDQKNYIRQAAITGLMGGLGKSNEKTVDNPDYIDAATDRRLRQSNSQYWASYWASLGFKSDGTTPLEVNEEDIPSKKSSSSSGGGRSQNDRRPYLGVVVVEGSGAQTAYGSDKEFREAHSKRNGNPKLQGNIVTKPDDLTNENKERLGQILAFSGIPDTDTEGLLDYASRNGISISVSGKGESGKQTLIVRDTKTQVTKGQSSNNEETEDFDATAVPTQ